MAERGGKIATVLWDLDQTIGNFGGMRALSPETAVPIMLRYGMHGLLNDFSEKNGYQHYITSSAGLGYIGEALRRTHLDSKFTKIFGNETVNQTDQGKHYRPVARDFSEDEMRAKMIVIGDGNRDKPVDIGGMVFVELGVPEKAHDALVIREILTTLLDEGEGNFKSGYEKLYDRAEPVDSSTDNSKRFLSIGNDIGFTMEYRMAEEVDKASLRRVPVICRIKADTHQKPFEPFF